MNLNLQSSQCKLLATLLMELADTMLERESRRDPPSGRCSAEFGDRRCCCCSWVRDPSDCNDLESASSILQHRQHDALDWRCLPMKADCVMSLRHITSAIHLPDVIQRHPCAQLETAYSLHCVLLIATSTPRCNVRTRATRWTLCIIIGRIILPALHNRTAFNC